MKFLYKYKLELIVFSLLIVIYFILRFLHVLSLPIFTDEAIYVRWAQIAKQDASWRFISLTDGKQPLFIWVVMLLMRIIKDPLLAGRVTSVFAGLGTMLGLFFLGRELFKNRWVGIISAALYVFFPFALVYDRMALYDSLVGTFAVWAIYAEVILVRKIRLDVALITGMVIGGSVLNKSSGFANIYFFPFSLLLFQFQNKPWKEKLFKWIGLAFIVWIITNLYYSVLRLSPFFHIIKDKDATFIYPISEWIHHPFTYFIGNLNGLFNWFQIYLTWPVIFLILLSFIIERKFWKEKLFLTLWFIAPFILAAIFNRLLYPRYVLFMVLPLLPLIAWTFVILCKKIRNKLLYIIIFMALFGMWFYADYFILFDFPHAPIPSSDLNQYVNDWPAGGGIPESVVFFKEKSLNQHIYIGTEGTFGLMPFVYEIYFNDNPNVKVKGFWPIHDTPPADLIIAAKSMPTYVVFYEPCPSCSFIGEAPKTWPLSLIAKYRKGVGNTYLSIYQLNK